MALRRAGYALVLVILVCAVAVDSTEGKSRGEELFSGNAGCRKFLEIDRETEEQAWKFCRKELIDRKDAAKSIVTHIPLEGSSDLKSTMLAEKDILKAISILPSQMKRTLLHCLRKKSIPSRVSGQEALFKHSIVNCIDLLFVLPNAPRRYLASKSRQELGPDLASAPASASLSNAQPHVKALDSFFPTDITDTSPPPTPSKRSLHIPPPKAQKRPVSPPAKPPKPKPTPPSPQPKKPEDDQTKTIIYAIAATAAATFLLVAVLFCCCRRCSSKKVGPKDGTKDDRPLLNLSLSDFSAGSSQKSVSIGNSSNREFNINSGKNSSFKSCLSMKSDNHDMSSAEAVSLEATTREATARLKPPPGKSAPPPPAPPAGPPPPPPPGPRPPPAPPKPAAGKTQASTFGHKRGGTNASSDGDDDSVSGSQKAKLKPFFWDKVLASPDQQMVWHEISAGSFQFNEEMIESLFGYNAGDKNKTDGKKESSSAEPSVQYIQIIDVRKAQNLSILLRALNVTTDEVIDALREGNELPPELLQTLLKMAPTTEEELKLRLFTGDLSQLGPAERFLKVLVHIPFAFKRLESLLFMTSLPEEVSGIKESFATLEVACNKLRNSRLFLKLLEAVLKTGNRMNDGTYRGGAQAFKLDTLLKLADVKGIDGKTTLLHFVVQEIIRSEGIRAVRTAKASQSLSSVKSEDLLEDSSLESADHYRALGLQVVSGLSNELEDVKKAAIIDADVLVAAVTKLKHSLAKTRDFLNFEMKSLDEESDFYRSLAGFSERAEADISWLSEEEKRIMVLVKSTADYFHGNAGKDEGLRLFAIVRDFLIMLDKSCKEVRDSAATKPMRNFRKEAQTVSHFSEQQQSSSNIRQRLFPAIADRRMDDSSSDDENPSP